MLKNYEATLYPDATFRKLLQRKVVDCVIEQIGKNKNLERKKITEKSNLGEKIPTAKNYEINMSRNRRYLADKDSSDAHIYSGK